MTCFLCMLPLFCNDLKKLVTRDLILNCVLLDHPAYNQQTKLKLKPRIFFYPSLALTRHERKIIKSFHANFEKVADDFLMLT